MIKQVNLDQNNNRNSFYKSKDLLPFRFIIIKVDILHTTIFLFLVQLVNN
jgi:hypothetical protein